MLITASTHAVDVWIVTGVSSEQCNSVQMTHLHVAVWLHHRPPVNTGPPANNSHKGQLQPTPTTNWPPSTRETTPPEGSQQSAAAQARYYNVLTYHTLSQRTIWESSHMRETKRYRPRQSRTSRHISSVRNPLAWCACLAQVRHKYPQLRLRCRGLQGQSLAHQTTCAAVRLCFRLGKG